MSIDTNAKYKALRETIEQYGSAIVALSGGVDSSLLAKVCYDMLGSRAAAVTIVSPMLPAWEQDDAKQVASLIGIEHILINEDTIDPTVRKNPADRCYHCKKIEFGAIVAMATTRGMDAVFDGSNADDSSDYRPGARAVHELKVLSPLQMVGLTKSEIRELSRELNLPTWDKPAYACLASRIPYGDEITPEKLRQVERAEGYLHSLGFRSVRVRSHDTIARIEVNPDDRANFCSPDTMDRVSRKLKEFGFLYVCMELEGYSMGSLNRKLK